MAQQTITVPRVFGGTLLIQVTIVLPPPMVTTALLTVRDGMAPLHMRDGLAQQKVRDGVQTVKGR